MPEKKTISGRVPADTWERFEQYREAHDLNKTDAMRRLLEDGLDANKVGIGEQEEEDVEVGPLTHSEDWFQQQFESSFLYMLLTAPATLALLLAFGGAQFYFPVDVGEWWPTMILALLIFLGMAGFLMFFVATVITGLFLKLGWARRIDQWQSGENGAAG